MADLASSGRNGAPKKRSPTRKDSTRAQPAHPRPPFLPTYRETALLAVFPALLLFGGLYSVLSPDARADGQLPVNLASAAGTVSTGAGPIDASHYPAGGPQVPNYFARKDNILNVFFVKRGWFWISLAFFAFVWTHPAFQGVGTEAATGSSSGSTSGSTSLLSRRFSAILRWSLITGWWILVTQWCFGPPIIDRSFRLTGGVCHFDVFEGVDVASVLPPVAVPPRIAPTAALACKRSGGRWAGGHDISGHVFMLVLGCTFLAQEVGSILLRTAGRPGLDNDDGRCIVTADGSVQPASVEAAALPPSVSSPSVQLLPGAGAGPMTPAQLALRFAAGVVALSLWMLLMTAIYFHTGLEKLTGLLVALAGLYSVYMVPRFVPGVRRVVGLPGL